MEVYLIYGITDCPACLKAQAVLMERDLEYVFIEMDFSKSYRDSVIEQLRWPTFPIIIKTNPDGEEELVGGYDDLCYILEKEDTSPA